MVDITLYGLETLTYQYLKEKLLLKSSEVGIDLNLREVNDIDQIMNRNILSVPAFQIGDEHKYVKNTEPNDSLEDLYKWVIANENYQRITEVVIPVDFSYVSLNALEYGLEYAQAINAKARILHIFNPSPIPSDDDKQTSLLTEEKSKDMLDKLVSKFKAVNQEIDSNQIVSDFRVGFAADEIIDISKEKGVLLVMANTGASGFKKIFGSVSTKVATHAAAPILLIPRGAKYQTASSVVYACKNPELDKNLIAQVAGFIKESKPRLYLVNLGANSTYPLGQLVEEWSQFYTPGKVISHKVEVDDVAEALAEFAKTHTADIMIVAREEKTLFKSLFYKSILKAIIVNANLPVLILNNLKVK